MKIIEQSAEILDWSGLDLYQRVEQAARVCRRSESKGDAEGFVRSLIRRAHYPPLEFARVEIYWEGVGIDVFNVRRLREMLENHIDATAFLCSNLIWKVWKEYPAFFEGIGVPYANNSGASWKPANDWIPVLFVTSRSISHQLVRYRRDICFMQESQRHVRYDRDGIEVIEPPDMPQYAREIMIDAVLRAERAYQCLLWETSCRAEQARAVLPGCTATRILAYASPQEWRHIFSQRCDEHADPQMSALMRPLQEQMKERGLI